MNAAQVVSAMRERLPSGDTHQAVATAQAENCPHCHGDGMDPWNDYLLPCPLCQGPEVADAHELAEADLAAHDTAMLRIMLGAAS